MSDDQNPMKAYIEKEVAQRTDSEITELLLDNCKSKEIVGLEGHNFEKLTQLSFIGCDLQSLNGLVKLPGVRVLDLSENSISLLEKIPENLPSLYHLNICGNPINSVDQLKPLSKLENLKALDIYDCPLTEVNDYRELVFEAIPNIKFLNGFDINDEEADDLSDAGESTMGEMGYEDENDSVEEDEDIGLEYLNSSKALKDEDTSEFVPDKTNGSSKKRKTANGDAQGEPNKKKTVKEE